MPHLLYFELYLINTYPHHFITTELKKIKIYSMASFKDKKTPSENQRGLMAA